MSWMKGTSNIWVTVCDTEDTGWSTAGVVCRIYIHISRISNTLLQVTFYSSSIFKCAISNYFYIYNELNIALQGEATMFSFVPCLLSWRAVILAQFFINTYYCFSTSLQGKIQTCISEQLRHLWKPTVSWRASSRPSDLGQIRMSHSIMFLAGESSYLLLSQRTTFRIIYFSLYQSTGDNCSLIDEHKWKKKTPKNLPFIMKWYL